METRAHYLFVGIGVLAITLVLGFSLVWLYNKSDSVDTENHTIVFEKHSMSGVQVGSAVSMRGIRIGEVMSISLNGKEKTIGAKVKIKIRADAPLTPNIRATIERNLLTGLASIELTEAQNSPLLAPDPLEKSSKGEEDSGESDRSTNSKAGKILEGVPEVQRIKLSLGDTLLNVNATLEDIQDVLSPQNRKKISKILTEANRITHNLADQLDGVGNSTQDTVEGLKSLIKKIDSLVTTFQSATVAVTQQTARTTAKIQETADTFSKTVKKYEDPQSIIFGQDRNGRNPSPAN